MSLVETEFAQMSFQEEDSLYILRWKSDHQNLNDDLFKEQVNIWLENIKKCRPQRLLVDTSLFNYVVVPEIQDWFDEKVFALYPQIGVQKQAMLLPEDLFTQVSIQQTNESPKNQTFEVNYFDNEQKALEWLSA
ncbi:MAG TPA: hypothetical protein DCS93_23105 [Microscillaceae bacterium]|nr:hypothetical protein [Microscillaceae bacterium]